MTYNLEHVPTRLLPPGHGRLEGSRYAVVAELRRAVKAGEVRPVTPLRVHADGTASVLYVRLRDPRPAWVRPATIAGGAVAGAGALGWLAYRAALSVREAVTDTAPAIGFLIALSLVLLVVAAVRRRGRTVTVTTTTVTRVRVR